MQPHQAGIPQVAAALRHETVLAKEPREKVHTSQTHPCVGNASIPSSTDRFPRRSLTHGTACAALQTVLSQRLRLKLKKGAALISYGELCECCNALFFLSSFAVRLSSPVAKRR